MSATPRELVYQTLQFEDPARVPRQLWWLPWAHQNHPETMALLERDFPPDIVNLEPPFRTPPPRKGDPYAIGKFVDEWGCVFENLHEGIIGEVREQLVEDWETDYEKIHFPRELLSIDRDEVNRKCAATDQFCLPGTVPRPFERLQFLRTSEELYMDLMDPHDNMLKCLKEIHQLNCEIYEIWAKTDVDGLMVMDDWGAQNALLVNPGLWRELFKPLYRDYIEIAHSSGKKMFMHSDGNLLAILPDLVEIGLDALNSQIFCMGAEEIEPFAGKLTFWGEIDRQYILPKGSKEEADAAVRKVHKHLWRKGGCIAQCEFGPGAKPENVIQVFESWNALSRDPAAGT